MINVWLSLQKITKGCSSRMFSLYLGLSGERGKKRKSVGWNLFVCWTCKYLYLESLKIFSVLYDFISITNHTVTKKLWLNNLISTSWKCIFYLKCSRNECHEKLYMYSHTYTHIFFILYEPCPSMRTLENSC